MTILTYLVIFDNYLGGFRQAPVATHAMLRHLDLIEQIGVTIQHFEQLDQGQ